MAREKESERDKKSSEADHLMHQHHRFANSVAMPGLLTKHYHDQGKYPEDRDHCSDQHSQ